MREQLKHFVMALVVGTGLMLVSASAALRSPTPLMRATMMSSFTGRALSMRKLRAPV